MMYRHSTIKSISAVFMLLVMALSVTPKIVLHDWFANHQDAPTKKSTGDQEQVSKRLFNCNCDNIVAESPFTDQCNDLDLSPATSQLIQQGSKPVSFYSSTPSFFSLRGPPAFC